jgi:hypothetical protein
MSDLEKISICMTRIIGISLTVFSCAFSGYMIVGAIYCGPAYSPPLLQYALWTLVLPVVMFIFTCYAGQVGRLVFRSLDK